VLFKQICGLISSPQGSSGYVDKIFFRARLELLRPEFIAVEGTPVTNASISLWIIFFCSSNLKDESVNYLTNKEA